MSREQVLLNVYINQVASKYVDFMSIDVLPEFKVVEKKISLTDANKKGFGSFAAHVYDIPTGTHQLKVWSEIYKPQLHVEYLLYHEFTHILDTEMYVQNDKMKHVMYRGFTEYHAGQIEFLKLLGAEKANLPIAFSMNQRFKTVGNSMAAMEFLVSAHKTASELIVRGDFPADAETLSVTFGLIFNYWGRRSICKKYALDYIEKVDNTAIEKLIGKEPFKALNAYMKGWLSGEQIELIGNFFFKMFASKMEEYSLL